MKNLRKKIVSQLQLTFSRAIMCGHPWPVQLLINREEVNRVALRMVGKICGSLIIAVALIIVFLVDIKALPVIAGLLFLWLLEGYINYLIQSKRAMKAMPYYIEKLVANQEFIDLATALFPKKEKRIIYDPNGANNMREDLKKLLGVKVDIDVLVNTVMVISALGKLGCEIKIDFWITREVMKYLKTLGYPTQE